MSAIAKKNVSNDSESKLREAEIAKIIDSKSSHSRLARRINYKGEMVDLPAYKIPIKHLVFNKYNGRIASRVKSYITQNHKLDEFSKEGRNTICKFLWEASEAQNKKTLQSLKDHNQIEVGIVTSDGVIVDGNRRASLLLKLHQDGDPNEPCLLAVVLPDALDNDPKEIMRLETEYQIGEDKKVEYNAIEKYLKCADLKVHYNEKQIAALMGDDEPNIKKIIEIKGLMDDYLKSMEYDGLYTMLEAVDAEGVFWDFHSAMKAFQGKSPGKYVLDWELDKSDLAELKNFFFHMVRANYRGPDGSSGKGYRQIFTNKGTSIISKKNVWQGFCDKFFNEMEPILAEEESVNEIHEKHPGEEFQKELIKRDKIFAESFKKKVDQNFYASLKKLSNKQDQDKPEKLLANALEALEEIQVAKLADMSTETKTKLFSLAQSINKLSHKIKVALES